MNKECEDEDDSFDDLLPPNPGTLIIKVVEARLLIDLSPSDGADF